MCAEFLCHFQTQVTEKCVIDIIFFIILYYINALYFAAYFVDVGYQIIHLIEGNLVLCILK